MTDARELDIQLHLLDRQVIDVDGRFVCNVDDLEMEYDDTGRPYVTAILVGARALAPRLGGRLGVWVHSIARRLSEDRNDEPLRIDFAQVTEIGNVIKVARKRDELHVTPLEAWVDEHVIKRIPGSRHENE